MTNYTTTKFRHLPCVLLLAAAGVRAQTPAAPVPPAATPVVAPADADWAVVKASFSPASPRPTTGGGYAIVEWGMRYTEHLLQCGETFFAQHPTDSRRWTALQQMETKFTAWTTNVRTAEEKKAVDDVMDSTARAAWRAKLNGWIAAGVAADDVPPAMRVQFDAFAFQRLRGVAGWAVVAKAVPDYAAVRAELDRLAAKYPGSDEIGGYAVSYIELKKFGGVSTDALNAEMRELAQNPHPAIRAKIAAKLRLAEEISKPLELSFTAADGRAVDLAQLRGKVVLVDFWATWCGPCKAELPNVIATYKKYHDQGFEIVGISLENAKLLPADTPEQTTTKLEAAKKILTEFTTKEKMPWPQYFDGTFWRNPLVKKYAIAGIPAMFLLDQEGKVVSTNARGEKLESEVKRLLKL